MEGKQRRIVLVIMMIGAVLLPALAGPVVAGAPVRMAAADGSGQELATRTAAPAAQGSLLERLTADMRAALQGGSVVWALFVAFLAGLLTSLMGCVYPLIPVAMAVIGTRETRSRWGALGLSAVYVLGMCLLYTTLGLVFAGLGKAFGSWMGSAWVVGFIALFFTLMGLAMAGVFEIRLPARLEARLNRLGGKGVAGAFSAGLVSGLVMAPCTGPVLSVVLVFIASSQSFFLGFWLLFFMSLGTGFLFLVIGTFSGVVSHLPRSGSWMEIIRSAFAMIMIGMGVFFLRGACPGLDQATASLPGSSWWALVALALAALAGGFHIGFPDASVAGKTRKLAGLALGSAGVLLLAVGLLVGPAAAVHWEKDLQHGLALGRSRHRPVMLDFWATWCPACLKLDSHTYSDPQVARELDRFVAVKIDCTASAENEKLEKLMERYGAMDLPTVRFVDSRGRLLEQPVLKGFVGPEKMLELLQGIR